MPRLRTYEEILRLRNYAWRRAVDNCQNATDEVWEEDNDFWYSMYKSCVAAGVQCLCKEQYLEPTLFVPAKTKPETFADVDWDARLDPEHAKLLD